MPNQNIKGMRKPTSNTPPRLLTAPTNGEKTVAIKFAKGAPVTIIDAVAASAMAKNTIVAGTRLVIESPSAGGTELGREMRPTSFSDRKRNNSTEAMLTTIPQNSPVPPRLSTIREASAFMQAVATKEAVAVATGK